MKDKKEEKIVFVVRDAKIEGRRLKVPYNIHRKYERDICLERIVK